MTGPSYPVDPSPAAQEACCAAYDAALEAEESARIVVPDDLASHAEVHGLRAALPYVLRDELARLVHDAFGDDYDGSDYHYALEALRDGVVGRLEELERYVETATGVTTEEEPS